MVIISWYLLTWDDWWSWFFSLHWLEYGMDLKSTTWRYAGPSHIKKERRQSSSRFHKSANICVERNICNCAMCMKNQSIFDFLGSTSVRTGSWWSFLSWRRPTKEIVRSCWSKRSVNAASSSTSCLTPSPTWSGRRWSGLRCRRWWSMSPRTGECSRSRYIRRWVKIVNSPESILSTNINAAFRLSTCSPSTFSGPFLPQTTPRWAETIYKSSTRVMDL